MKDTDGVLVRESLECNDATDVVMGTRPVVRLRRAIFPLVTTANDRNKSDEDDEDDDDEDDEGDVDSRSRAVIARNRM